MNLHRLPVEEYTIFQKLTFAQRCQQDNAPVYLSELLHPYERVHIIYQNDQFTRACVCSMFVVLFKYSFIQFHYLTLLIPCYYIPSAIILQLLYHTMKVPMCVRLSHN